MLKLAISLLSRRRVLVSGFHIALSILISVCFTEQLELVGVDGSQTVVVLQSVHPEDMDAEDAMIIQQQGDEEMEHGIDTPHRQNSRETRGRVIAVSQDCHLSSISTKV